VKQKLRAKAAQKKEFIHSFPLAGSCPASSWKARAKHELLGKTNTMPTIILSSTTFP